MRLVIGVLADVSASYLLTDEMILGGCPAERLLFLSNDGTRLEKIRPDKPTLALLGQHRSVWMWAVHEPYYYAGRVRDSGQQRRQNIELIERFAASGVSGAWHVHQDHVNEGRLVSIVNLDQEQGNQMEFMRTMLAHATRRMQISDLVDDNQVTINSPVD